MPNQTLSQPRPLAPDVLLTEIQKLKLAEVFASIEAAEAPIMRPVMGVWTPLDSKHLGRLLNEARNLNGCYIFVCLTTGKYYIGCSYTKAIKNRFQNHVAGKGGNEELYDCITDHEADEIVYAIWWLQDKKEESQDSDAQLPDKTIVKEVEGNMINDHIPTGKLMNKQSGSRRTGDKRPGLSPTKPRAKVPGESGDSWVYDVTLPDGTFLECLNLDQLSYELGLSYYGGFKDEQSEDSTREHKGKFIRRRLASTHPKFEKKDTATYLYKFKGPNSLVWEKMGLTAAEAATLIALKKSSLQRLTRFPSKGTYSNHIGVVERYSKSTLRSEGGNKRKQITHAE